MVERARLLTGISIGFLVTIFLAVASLQTFQHPQWLAHRMSYGALKLNCEHIGNGFLDTISAPAPRYFLRRDNDKSGGAGNDGGAKDDKSKKDDGKESGPAGKDNGHGHPSDARAGPPAASTAPPTSPLSPPDSPPPASSSPPPPPDTSPPPSATSLPPPPPPPDASTDSHSVVETDTTSSASSTISPPSLSISSTVATTSAVAGARVKTLISTETTTPLAPTPDLVTSSPTPLPSSNPFDDPVVGNPQTSLTSSAASGTTPLVITTSSTEPSPGGASSINNGNVKHYEGTPVLTITGSAASTQQTSGPGVYSFVEPSLSAAISNNAPAASQITSQQTEPPTTGPTPNSDVKQGKNNHSKTIAIALGTVFGVLALFALGLCLFIWYRRSQSKKRRTQRDIEDFDHEQTFAAPASSPFYGGEKIIDGNNGAPLHVQSSQTPAVMQEPYGLMNIAEENTPLSQSFDDDFYHVVHRIPPTRAKDNAADSLIPGSPDQIHHSDSVDDEDKLSWNGRFPMAI